MVEKFEEVAIKMLAYLCKRSPDFLKAVTLEVYPYDDNQDSMERYTQGQNMSKAMDMLRFIGAIKWVKKSKVSDVIPGFAQDFDYGNVTIFGRLLNWFPRPVKYLVFWCAQHIRTVIAVLGALGFVTLISRAIAGVEILSSYVHGGITIIGVVVVSFVFSKLLHRFF